MKEITFKFDEDLTDIQIKTLSAIVESFEQKSVNMDKFIMWVLKNYKPGTSVCLRVLGDI